MNFKKHRLLPRLLCNRPALIWIVGINIAAFLCLRIIAVVLNLSGNIHLQQPMLEWVALPATLEHLASRPWTVLTYMFCQYEAQHIILNMLILYWAGSLYAGMRGGKHLVTLYMLGGFAGAFTYMALYAVSPGLSTDGAFLLGSSASVFAIMAATALKAPKMQINLFLIGNVPVWVVVTCIMAFDIILGSGGENLGGHLSHLGGAIAGALSAMASRRHLKRFRSPGTKVTADSVDSHNLNLILDKIKNSGYSSLTAAERKTLFEISDRIK